MASKFSLLNLVASASAVTGSTTTSGYPAANVKTPERPFMPWKPTVATDSSVVIDFGTAKVLDVVALINVNFTSARIQGNASDSWGAPSYNQLVTIARNPWNTRYQHAHQATAFNYRYLRIFIPTQSPTEGSVFSVGGIFAGANTALPRGIRSDYTMQPHEPGIDVGPDGDAWVEHVVLGDIWTGISGHLTLEVGRPPALSDQTQGWLEILRQAPKSTPTLLALEGSSDPAQCWVVRRLNDPMWRVGGAYADTDLEFRELV